MRNPWVLAILTVVGFLLISMAISWLGVRNRLDTLSSHEQFTVISDSVETSVVVNHNFLNIVILHLKNPSLNNTGDFRFSIVNPEGSEIRQLEFTGYNVGDPSDLRFQFDPIPESFGKEFILRVEAVSKEGNLISASTGKDGNLAFSAYYRTVSKKQALEELFGTWKKNTANDLTFFVSWAFVLGLTVYLANRKE